MSFNNKNARHRPIFAVMSLEHAGRMAARDVNQEHQIFAKKDVVAKLRAIGLGSYTPALYRKDALTVAARALREPEIHRIKFGAVVMEQLRQCEEEIYEALRKPRRSSKAVFLR